MAHFFDELDAVYCLCIEERKQFVIKQATKLNIFNKLVIIDADTPNSDAVDEIITNHRFFPILGNSTIYIAATLGLQKIMIDIVKNKLEFAMILEDDVLFLESMFDFANKTITKNNIRKHFDTNLPYNLYLISTIHENTFANQTGIIHQYINYGQPAYILNHHLCSLLLNNLYPITGPVDDYKNAIERKYQVQCGILVPYICRELSANFFNFDTSELSFKFKRTHCWNNAKKIVLSKQIYVDANAWHRNLILSINPDLNLSFDKIKSHDTIMKYSFGTLVEVLNNSYICSCTIDNNIEYCRESFIFSVKGKRSAEIINKKFGFSPIVADYLLLMSLYLKKERLIRYQYCFIYDDADFGIVSDTSFQLIKLSDINVILDAIVSSNFVISDNTDYITIGNSYGIPGVYAVVGNSAKYAEIAADYYSNITSENVEPISLNVTNQLVSIDSDVCDRFSNFIQPVLPIAKNTFDDLLDVFPFVTFSSVRLRTMHQQFFN